MYKDKYLNVVRYCAGLVKVVGVDSPSISMAFLVLASFLVGGFY